MMEHTYSDGECIYDVAALIEAAASCDRFRIITSELVNYLEDDRWGSCLPIEFLFHCQYNCCQEHEEKIARAELSHPIIFGPEHELLDGVHRVVKAARRGDMSVSAVRLPQMPLPTSNVREMPLSGMEKRTRVAAILRRIWNTDLPRSVTVDLACLAVSRKRFARVAWSGGVGEFRQVLEEYEFSVRHACGALYYGFGKEGVEELVSVDNSRWPHVFRLGGMLGYPTCCCLTASELGECRLDEWQDQVANACDVLCPAISPRAYPEGRARLSHIPCSPTCQPSRAIARDVTEFLRELHLAWDG